MLWHKLTRWVAPVAVFLGTAALTIAIFTLPGLSLGVLAALVSVRLLMGLVRIVVMFQLVGAWLDWRSTPRLEGGV